MNLYHDIPLGNEDFSEINAILEIPKGSRVKYEFDYKTGALWVDRVGKTPIDYTFNYGDLPQTWNKGDNDPLDVIILCSQAIAPGVVVPLRVVGGLKMVDSGEDDYKILAVADDKFYSDIKDISDVNKKELEEIEYYMLHYKDLHGKKIELNGWDDKETAKKILAKCHEDYKKKFGK
ncbi:inorganic pyrophosphatase [Candidatus Gracilibacteria bacterium]|nr:MAG: inorganic pyrophosphatase [Candidatus Gracilibacteria bacterium]